MKNIVTRIAPALALWALIFVSHAAARTKHCYPAANRWAMGPGGVWVLSEGYDRDGDGYAKLTAAEAIVPRFEMEVDGMHCPAGYVDQYGDCNDEPGVGANIHPRRMEIGYNAVDDNCSGVNNEPTMYYAAEGVMNSSFPSWLTMRWKGWTLASSVPASVVAQPGPR